MKQKLTNIGKWALFCLLLFAGVICSFVLLGEYDIDTTADFIEFLALKLGSIAGIVVIYHIGKLLNRRGLLPDIEKYFGNHGQ